MGITGGGICLNANNMAVPAKDRWIDGVAKVEKIPNTTTGVLSNGTGTMVSASLLGSLSSYAHFKHIVAVEDVKVQPGVGGIGMLARKVRKGKEEVKERSG